MMNFEKLNDFLPKNAFPFIQTWLSEKQLIIKITRPRKNKLGDCKKLGTNQYQITVNGDLKPETFFFVLTHEIAHLLVFEKHKRVAPHGKEWKQQFKALLEESVKVYSEDVQPLILTHAKKPKANLLADRNISLVLFEKQDELKLEDLKDGEKFSIGNRKFVRLRKQKIRYICREISTKKMYSISGLAAVDKIQNE